MLRRHWQWSLTQIRAPEAWHASEGDGVVVAVLDTGVDARHGELAGKVLAGHNVLAPGYPAGDDNGHGTAVSAIIAGHGGFIPGFRGVAPLARIMPLKTNEPGTGHVRAPNIAAGIRWALDHGADVLNLSVGCVLDEPDFGLRGMSDLANAIAEALRRGVPVVCAAGPQEERTFPAAWTELPEFDGLVAVGATDHRDQLHWWSPRRSYVTLNAPACATTAFPVWTPYPYQRFGGTSAAAPHVAGVLALLRALRPELRPPELARVLRSTAQPVAGRRFLRVDAAEAVRAVARRRVHHLGGIGAHRCHDELAKPAMPPPGRRQLREFPSRQANVAGGAVGNSISTT